MSVYTNDFLVKLKRKNYLTPTHYLDYINVYLNLIDEKSTIITRQVIISVQNYKLLLYSVEYTQRRPVSVRRRVSRI